MSTFKLQKTVLSYVTCFFFRYPDEQINGQWPIIVPIHATEIYELEVMIPGKRCYGQYMSHMNHTLGKNIQFFHR